MHLQFNWLWWLGILILGGTVNIVFTQRDLPFGTGVSIRLFARKTRSPAQRWLCVLASLLPSVKLRGFGRPFSPPARREIDIRMIDRTDAGILRFGALALDGIAVLIPPRVFGYDFWITYVPTGLANCKRSLVRAKCNFGSVLKNSFFIQTKKIFIKVKNVFYFFLSSKTDKKGFK